MPRIPRARKPPVATSIPRITRAGQSLTADAVVETTPVLVKATATDGTQEEVIAGAGRKGGTGSGSGSGSGKGGKKARETTTVAGGLWRTTVYFYRPDEKDGYLGQWWPSRFVADDGGVYENCEQCVFHPCVHTHASLSLFPSRSLDLFTCLLVECPTVSCFVCCLPSN